MADDRNFFYIDILDTANYTFYYNMVAEVNKGITRALRSELPDRLMTPRAMAYRNNVLAGGLTSGKGPGEFGVMANYDVNTGNIEYLLADSIDWHMKGICATVSANMAEEIVERAQYYCPVDKGHLIKCFRIEDLGNGKCRIYNDCHYAWFVEEFTWKHHDYPKRAKFLTTAVFEIQNKYGFGWARGV